MALKIRKGDTVQVIAGDDKGKTGRVLSVDETKNRLVIEKINLVKRHTKANPQAGIAGGIIEKEASLHLSNVQPVCGRCDKPVRSGIKVLADGRKLRVCKRCGEPIDKG